MDGRGVAKMISFFTAESFSAGDVVRLGEGAAQHARVRRVETGAAVRLVDGKGRVGDGTIIERSSSEVVIRLDAAVELPPPLPLHLVVPVADRDRMLLAAEKAAEFQVTVWQPTYFERSRSVNPRGEGEKFRAKVRARMAAALEQSGGAWLPEIRDEIEGSAAWRSVPDGWARLILDSRGTSMSRCNFNGPMAIAIGPEGGFAESELAEATSTGWVPVSLATTILRFETAVIASAAVVRSNQGIPSGGS